MGMNTLLVSIRAGWLMIMISFIAAVVFIKLALLLV